jgi:hypothetical protein
METNYINIQYMNNTVTILQYVSESNIQFNKRIEYIRLLEAAKVEWIDAYKYSKIWYCIKFKKCKYLPEIYNKIISYEKNNY